MVRTKIICTIGPASNNETVMRKMMLRGMDVARINFSHGTYRECAHAVAIIRRLNKKYRRHVRILGDLEGFRIRIGDLAHGEPLELKKRQMVLLAHAGRKVAPGVIPFDYEGPLTDIRAGTFLYIDDGSIALSIKKSSKTILKAEVVVPGVVKEHKGVNIPDVNLKFKGLTSKDKADIEFAVRNKFDYIAQSFVRSEHDIIVIRNFVKDSPWQGKLIAKIENRPGLKNIDKIIEVCDGIMIARGDMGVSLPIYEIPIVQKLIIKKCNQKKKFVITATQMLESMTEHIRPTRAEVTDVANAILDGTDLVMLSGETAVGKYPAECVQMMNQIIKYTEEAVKDNVIGSREVGGGVPPPGVSLDKNLWCLR